MSHSGAGPGLQALARAGYAVAGALAAVLASRIVASPFRQADFTMVEQMTGLIAMGVTLMLWASFKPSRASGEQSALEALLVVFSVVGVQLVGAFVQAEISGYHAFDAVGTMFGALLLMLFNGVGAVLAVSWLLGSSRRWTVRSLWWVVGEVAFAAAVFAAYTGGVLTGFLQADPWFALAFVSAAVPLAAAAALQRSVFEIVQRARGEQELPAEPRPRLRSAQRPTVHPRHAPVASASRVSASRCRLRMVCVAALVVSILVSVAAIVFFLMCRQYAFAQGLDLRNLVYDIPSICVFATSFAVVPFVAVEAATGQGKDYRVTGCAVLSALVLLVALFFTAFRPDSPEEALLPDGTIEVTTPVWLDKPRVSHAEPVGPFFMRTLPEPREDELEPVEAPTPPPGQSGHSFHNTGSIVSIDLEARVLVLAISYSTEGIPTATQVTVECASAEHFDVPFDELAVGDSVQIRSTEPFANGVILAQKVFGPALSIVPEQQEEGAETLDEVFEACGCDYAVSGTVTSAIEENGFSFRVDDGGGFIENGTELRVSTAFVERRLLGMKGLQWGMDGVIIGFSDMPAEGILRAKVIVGNDDTSSAYWENMPPA